MRLSTRKRELLNRFSVPEILPTFLAYEDPVTNELHFNSGCVNTPAKEYNFVDLWPDEKCLKCLRTDEAKLHALIEGSVNHLLYVFQMAADAKVSLDEAISGDHIQFYNTLRFMRELWREKNIAASQLACNPYLHVLLPSFEQYFADLYATLFAHIASDKGLSQIKDCLSGISSGNFDAFTYTATLYQEEEIGSVQDLVASAFNPVELTPGRFIVFAPVEVHLFLANLLVSAPLDVPEGTSMEVLKTMSTLWEPDSSSVLNSAAAALKAAIVLTPEKHSA